MTVMDAHATTDNRHAEVRIDGTRWVSIRPIDQADASALSDFYATLSPESRRLRFMGCGVEPSPALVAALAASPGLVGVLHERGPRDGAIVAHASIHPGDGGCAEEAFAVADELQGHGLGRVLVAGAISEARRLSIGQISATLLTENGPMRHLLRNAGPRVVGDRIDSGTEKIVLELAAA